MRPMLSLALAYDLAPPEGPLERLSPLVLALAGAVALALVLLVLRRLWKRDDGSSGS
ncbi:MAG: hypothetical protein ACKO4Q_03335 [Planctomycetota bacterium]